MSSAILIVDDEPHVLQALQRLLRGDGYEIHLAASGPDALKILSETQVAVVLCDHQMPGMTGAEVLSEAHRLHPDTVRLTLTGHADLASVQLSVNEGHVSQFLLKPWDDDQLRAVVKDAVEAYQLVQDSRRSEAIARQEADERRKWNARLKKEVAERTNALRAQNEQLQNLRKQVEQSLRSTVSLLATTLEAHNPNLGIHCKRVARLARQLASQLELSEGEARDVEFAAHLHDIGKISRSVPPPRGSTPKPDAGDPRALRAHAEAGYAILSKVSGFERIAEAVRHQHDQFSGSETPGAMNGDEIPLTARIIAVANAYDEVVYPPSGAAEFLPDAGEACLNRESGKRFDPHVVKLLLNYVKQFGAAADQDAEVEVSPTFLKKGMILSRSLLNADGTLLLKSGASLTAASIRRIQGMGCENPMLAGVFVQCGPGEGQHEGYDDPQKRRSTMVSSNPAPDSASGGAENPDGIRWRILVVDDCTLVCNALHRELRPAGIETISVDSGWDALRLFDLSCFDAAIIDLKMPAMPGEELIKRLEQEAPALPCIVLTGNATLEIVRDLSAKPNVAGILTKPWDSNRIVSTIVAAIAKDGADQVMEPV